MCAKGEQFGWLVGKKTKPKLRHRDTNAGKDRDMRIGVKVQA